MAGRNPNETKDGAQRDKPPKRWPVVAGVAATAAAALAYLNRSEDITPIAPNAPAATAPEIPTDSASGKVERAPQDTKRETAKPTLDLTALRIKPEQFKDTRINLRRDGNSLVLETIPLEEVMVSMSYSPPDGYMPLLDTVTSAKDLENIRTDTRKRIQAAKPTASQSSMFVKKYRGKISADALEITRISPKNHIVLQIDLGKDTGRWLANLWNIPAEITQKVNEQLAADEPVVRFLKQANLSSDKNAHNTLLRIFAMDNSTRVALKQALAQGDIQTAGTIIGRMGASPDAKSVADTITQDLFEAVKNYGMEATSSKMPPKSARDCLHTSRLADMQYDERKQQQNGEIIESAARIIRRTMREDQFEALKKLPPGILKYLANAAIPDKGKPAVEYSEFMQKIYDENNLDFHPPEAILRLIQNNADGLFGTHGSAGWLDSTDSTFNLPHLISAMSADAVETMSALSQNLQSREPMLKNNKLTIVIPTQDLDIANRLLARTGILMQAACNELAIPEAARPYPQIAAEVPLAIRLRNAEVSIKRQKEDKKTVPVQQELLPNAETLLFPITAGGELGADILKALEGMTKTSTVQNIEVYVPANTHAADVEKSREQSGTRGR